MKLKLFLLSSMWLMCTASFSQIIITFTVNVSGMYIGPGGVHIAGEFAKDSSTSILSDWNPDANGSYMTLISPNTYTVNVTFPNISAGDSLQFEFVRDSVWGNGYGDMSEGNPGDPLAFLNDSCGYPDGIGGYNRLIFIPNCSGVYECVFNYCASIETLTPTITQDGYVLTSSVAAYYQWQLNGADIPGATNQSFTVQEEGYYAVVVNNENGCQSSATIWVEFLSVVDRSDTESSHIFPNPASSYIMIGWTSVEKGELQIFNPLGQLIFSENVTSERQKINVSPFANGMYEVVVITASKKYLAKFLKQ